MAQNLRWWQGEQTESILPVSTAPAVPETQTVEMAAPTTQDLWEELEAEARARASRRVEASLEFTPVRSQWARRRSLFVGLVCNFGASIGFTIHELRLVHGSLASECVLALIPTTMAIIACIAVSWRGTALQVRASGITIRLPFNPVIVLSWSDVGDIRVTSTDDALEIVVAPDASAKLQRRARRSLSHAQLAPIGRRIPPTLSVDPFYLGEAAHVALERITAFRKGT